MNEHLSTHTKIVFGDIFLCVSFSSGCSMYHICIIYHLNTFIKFSELKKLYFPYPLLVIGFENHMKQ